MRLSRLLIAALPVWLFLPGIAPAQTTPSTVDPGRVQRDIPANRPAPVRIEQPSTVIEKETPEMPAGAETTRFLLHRILIEDASIFPEAELDALWSEKKDKNIPLSDIYAVAQALTQKYRAAGYLLSRTIVPPQEIVDGTVRLRVVEGYISGYEIEGEAGKARPALERYAQKIIAARPVKASSIERYLLLMNDLPGLTVKSVLAPDEKAPGAARMTLQVSRKRFDAGAGVDTFGNAYLGPERVSANVQANGFIDGADLVRASLLSAPDHNEVAYFSGGFQQVLGSEGTILGFDASHTATKPSLPPTLGGLLSPQGDAFSFILSAQQPLVRSRETNWSLNTQLEVMRSQTLYGPGFDQLKTRDDQRILSLGTQASTSDSWGGYNQGSITARKGLAFAGSSHSGEAGLSRQNGNPDFLSFVASATRLQNIWGPITLTVSGTGQWSDSALLASQEFGLGGLSFGRGYDTSEITGDSGLGGKVELGWAVPNVGQWWWLDTSQLYAFYDGGAVWNRNRLVGEDAQISLTSVGVGTRLQLLNRLSTDIFLAKPLTYPVRSRADDKQNDWRLQFSVQASY